MRKFLSVNPQWQNVKVFKAGHYSESTFDWLQTQVVTNGTNITTITNVVVFVPTWQNGKEAELPPVEIYQGNISPGFDLRILIDFLNAIYF